MVSAKRLRSCVLASDDLLQRLSLFPAANCRGGIHWNLDGDKLAASPGIVMVSLSIDASELRRDIERIESGELELPTVSAVRVCFDENFEDVALWLPEA